MGLVVSALIINWGLISWIHLRFRAHKKAEGKARSSRASATRSPTTCAWPSWRRSWW
jgi:amino acid permease